MSSPLAALELSNNSRTTAGILLITVVAVEYGGLTVPRLTRGQQPATGFQRACARAGHGHAGLLVVFALVAQILADAADMHGVTNVLARDGIWVAAILFPGMTPEATLDASAADVAEAAVVAMLHRLNAEYLRAFVHADTAWYDEHLSDDFVCILADGRRIDKTEYLRRNTKRLRVSDVTFDEIDVRPLGTVVLVQGVITQRVRGARTSTRYTDVWCIREGRWQAVAAQFTQVISS